MHTSLVQCALDPECTSSLPAQRLCAHHDKKKCLLGMSLLTKKEIINVWN